MKLLAIAGLIAAMFAMVLWPVLFAILGTALAVVLLVTKRTEHGLVLLVLAGGCGLYGLSGWRPQGNKALDEYLQAKLDASKEPTNPRDWRIVSLKARVVKEDPDTVCEWKLTVRNEGLKPEMFRGSIQFQDSRGTTVAEKKIEGSMVPAGTVAVFSGSLAMMHGLKIARAMPQIGAPAGRS